MVMKSPVIQKKLLLARAELMALRAKEKLFGKLTAEELKRVKELEIFVNLKF